MHRNRAKVRMRRRHLFFLTWKRILMTTFSSKSKEIGFCFIPNPFWVEHVKISDLSKRMKNHFWLAHTIQLKWSATSQWWLSLYCRSTYEFVTNFIWILVSRSWFRPRTYVSKLTRREVTFHRLKHPSRHFELIEIRLTIQSVSETRSLFY